MSEKNVRGSVIKGYLKYVKRTWGKKGLKECEDFVNINLDNIKDKEWYPQKFDSNILGWIAETKGEKYIERAGYYVMKDLGILSYIVKFVNIKSLLKKAPKSYEDGFDFGKISVDIEENEATIKMKGLAVDDWSCTAWLGAYKAMLDMTNTKGSVEKVKCELEGDNHCEYHIVWD